MKKILIPIIAGTIALYSCGTQKNLPISQDKKLENIVSHKKDSLIYNEPNAGSILYNDSAKSVYFKNSKYENLNISLFDANNLFELQEFIAKDLVPYSVYSVNKKNIEEHFDKKYDSFKQKFRNCRSFSPNKAMYIFLNNSKKTINEMISKDPNSSEKLKIFYDAISDSYDKLKSKRINFEGTCKTKDSTGNGVIRVEVNFNIKHAGEVGMMDDAMFNADNKLINTYSKVTGKDKKYFKNFDVKPFMFYKAITNNKVKVIIYYYPVEVKSFFDFKAKKTNKIFRKALNSLEGCIPDSFE